MVDLAFVVLLEFLFECESVWVRPGRQSYTVSHTGSPLSRTYFFYVLSGYKSAENRMGSGYSRLFRRGQICQFSSSGSPCSSLASRSSHAPSYSQSTISVGSILKRSRILPVYSNRSRGYPVRSAKIDSSSGFVPCHYEENIRFILAQWLLLAERVNENVDPSPGSDSTQMSPP